MRIDYGLGYRFYYALRGSELVLLLIGGDKSSQQRDIAKTKKLTWNTNDGNENGESNEMGCIRIP